MEDTALPQNGSHKAEEKTAEAGAPPEPAAEEQNQGDDIDAKKAFKRFLLINGIVVGAVLVIGVILFLFMIPSSSENASENDNLKAEVKRLQKLASRFGEKSQEQLRIEDLIRTLQPRLGPAVTGLIAQAVVQNSQTYNLPPELILSIIHNTSRFEITAEGSRGAVGLMHISPKIYRKGLQAMGITEQEAYHIDNNIRLGCMTLRQLRDQGRSMEIAIAMLTGNEGTVDDILVGFTNSMISDTKLADQAGAFQINGTGESVTDAVPPSNK